MTQSKKDISLIQNKVIVLDSSFLIEIMKSADFRKEFLDFSEELKSSLTIAAPVYVEFINGTQKIDDFYVNEEIIRNFRVQEPLINDSTIDAARSLATLLSKNHIIPLNADAD